MIAHTSESEEEERWENVLQRFGCAYATDLTDASSVLTPSTTS